MNYWLVKSEPSVYSWEMLVKDKRTSWEGVRNYRARNNMRNMLKGDLCFFYHSNEGKEIVGIAKVVKTAYQDPTTDDSNWVCVDIAPFKKLKKAISLEVIKKNKNLANMELLKIGRLSINQLKKEEFELILSLSEN